MDKFILLTAGDWDDDRTFLRTEEYEDYYELKERMSEFLSKFEDTDMYDLTVYPNGYFVCMKDESGNSAPSMGWEHCYYIGARQSIF